MRKDLTHSTGGRTEHLPVNRRSSFFTPWFDDYMDPARWFDDFFNREFSSLSNEARVLTPAIDIEETADEYVVSADLPGIKKEDINIECTGNQMSISAERKYESTEQARNVDRRERFYGTYRRSFTLPAGVDTDKIEAACEGGVLIVRIPKVEQAKAKRIQIGGVQTSSKMEGKH